MLRGPQSPPQSSFWVNSKKRTSTSLFKWQRSTKFWHRSWYTETFQFLREILSVKILGPAWLSTHVASRNVEKLVVEVRVVFQS